MTNKKLKKDETKKIVKKNSVTKEKLTILEKLKNFITGVKTEAKRVKWPKEKEMVKYSIATITFVVSCSLFFYLIDIIIAALHSVFK